MSPKKALSVTITAVLVATLAPAALTETAYADSGDVSVVEEYAQTDETDTDGDAESTDESADDATGEASGTDADAADPDTSGDVDEDSPAQVLSEDGDSPEDEEQNEKEDTQPAAFSVNGTLTTTGVQLTWDPVDGAEGYTVLRKTGTDTEYTELDTTASTTYTDTSVKSGTTYVYSVQVYAQDGTIGEQSEGSSIYVLFPSALTAADHTSASAVKITWGKVSGATGYYVYRKVSGGSWSKVKTTTSTSWTDSGLTNGKQYYYSIQAYSLSPEQTSAMDNTGVSVRKLASPTLKSAANASGGIKVTWKKVTGATGYYVYRKTSGGKWKRIASTKSTSYTDKSSLKSGTKYIYTVRAYEGSFKNRSWYNKSGVTERKLSIPTLKSASNASGGVKVTWKKVTGAKKYYVYRKKSGGSWKRIKTTTSTSYTDKSSLKSGTKYVYTVRAVNGSDTSWYKSAGVSVTRLSIPSLKSAKKTSKGIKVTWGKVSGATGYVVYRKTSGGSWKRIKTTKSTSYTDTSTKSAKYFYTVRAYKGSVKSWYKSAGISAASAMTSKAQKYSSGTKYLILVDRGNHTVGVYTGKKNHWTLKYSWDCVTGKSSTPTITGSYSTTGFTRTRLTTDARARWCTQINGGYFFHTILASESELGQSLSHGCIRLPVSAAKWIYNNIKKGTRVVIYN